MNILGISSYYHDSAACIIKDSEVIAAAEEERFSRKKFDDGFPKNSINYCLEEAGVSPKQLDCVAFYDKSILKFERLLDNYIAVAPKGLRSFLDVIPKWIHKRLWVEDEIRNHLPKRCPRYQIYGLASLAFYLGLLGLYLTVCGISDSSFPC